MSLRLRQTVAGKPNSHSSQSTSCLSVDKQAYIVGYLPTVSGTSLTVQAYTSSSNVILLNEELELNATLPFWDSLPRRSGSSSGLGDVKGVITSGRLVSGPVLSLPLRWLTWARSSLGPRLMWYYGDISLVIGRAA